MGPSTRSCKAGDMINLRLMFLNKVDKKKQMPGSKNIKIMVYIQEEVKDDVSSAGGFREEISTGEEDDDEPDIVSDQCIFSVSYQAKIWLTN